MKLTEVPMMLRLLGAFLFLASPAFAASTIDTTQPVQGVPYNAAPIRQNFGAAANDIGRLQGMNAGPSAPSAPTSGTLWLQQPSSGTTWTLNIWISPASAWVPIARIDAAAGIWMPPVGGGTLPSVVSAATTNLGSVPQAALYITGNQTIASFGSSVPAGVMKVLVFTGNAVLHNNNTSLILPGGIDLTPGAGGIVTAISLGGGNWQVAASGGSGGASGWPIHVPGSVGDGSHDDAPAFQAYFGGLPAGGSTVPLQPGIYYFASSVTLPPYSIVDCGVDFGTALGNTPTFNSNNMTGFRLGAGATITTSPGSELRNCTIFRHGLTFPVNTVAGYAGTAITFPSTVTNDVRLENLLIIGFNTCVDQTYQSDRFNFGRVECDAINGYVIGPSQDTSFMLMVRNWPWGTVGAGSPLTRSGTGFNFTGTGRNDDIKVVGLVDFGHAVGLDIEDPSNACCNIYFDNVWLDTNATNGLIAKTSVSFGRLWIWASSGPGIAVDGSGAFPRIAILSMSAGTPCIQLTNNASIQFASGDLGGCTGPAVDSSTSAGSRVIWGDLKIFPNGGLTTPYINLFGAGGGVAAPVKFLSVDLPTQTSDLLGSGNIAPLYNFGDLVSLSLTEPAPTVVVAGLGQQTAALADSGLFGGGLLLKASGNATGDGGVLLFGENSGHMRHFAAIKGSSVSGANGTSGDVDVATRFAPTDNALTIDLHIDHSGFIQLPMSRLAANLVSCASVPGSIQAVSDSNTVTWGATVAGGGANYILAFCDGTNWTVMGK